MNRSAHEHRLGWQGKTFAIQATPKSDGAIDQGPEHGLVRPLFSTGPHQVLERLGRQFSGAVIVTPDRVMVTYRGRQWDFRRETNQRPDRAREGLGAVGAVEAPMTGTVLDVLCAEGDLVDAGAPLVVLEAMKMEHRLTAPAPARVGEVVVKAGQLVDIGQVLVRLIPGEDATS